MSTLAIARGFKNSVSHVDRPDLQGDRVCERGIRAQPAVLALDA
jgi:hypothetical protein